MLVVGLTGGIGCGKTTVAKKFLALGIPVIDTDEISHALTAQGGAAIPLLQQAFGAGIFKTDGALNRPALRALMLSDAKAKAQLEDILHPMIHNEVKQRLSQTRAAYALVVIPLLIETGAYAAMLDRVLVVDCSEATQMERVLSRGGWGHEEIRAIMARQVDRKTRLEHADDVIDNEGNEAKLAEQVVVLHQQYLSLVGQARS